MSPTLTFVFSSLQTYQSMPKAALFLLITALLLSYIDYHL
jgi:hypothetical protein